MEDLHTYLSDHLAGSVAALELVDHLIKTYEEEPLDQFFKELREDINSDQDELRDLMRTLDAKESSIRKAGAWLAEKIGRIKLELGGIEEGGVGFLQALEGLLLGITGKRVLWRALKAAAETAPQLRGIDFDRLEKRATEQWDRVEAKRLETARKAFRSK
jgi:hypothetical protein